MRGETEIQRAHDILVSVILGDMTGVLTLSTRDAEAMHVAVDALCWVLSHGHSRKFAENLATIEEEIADLGFFLIDDGQARPRYARKGE